MRLELELELVRLRIAEFDFRWILLRVRLRTMLVRVLLSESALGQSTLVLFSFETFLATFLEAAIIFEQKLLFSMVMNGAARTFIEKPDALWTCHGHRLHRGNLIGGVSFFVFFFFI